MNNPSADRPPLLMTRTAAFIAVGLVSGYALAAVPNVELVTATCFCAGYVLGPGAGVFCGAFTEALFAGFHPMGSSFGLTLLAQVIGMALAGLLGSVCAILAKRASEWLRAALVVAFGILSTLIFDFITNLAFPITAGFSYSQTLASFALALPFAAIHLVSNTLVFAVIVAPILPRLQRIITP